MRACKYHTIMATLYILYELAEAFGKLSLLWHPVSGIPTTAFQQWHFHNSDSGSYHDVGTMHASSHCF